MDSLFLCDTCDIPLVASENRLVCEACGTAFASIEENIAVFFDTANKMDFFDKQVIERLSEKCRGFDRAAFLDSLNKTEFWEMDALNKEVGITMKFWWEPLIGKIENRSILEVGCGINYIVPYWLECGNEVVAFDACKESILLLRQLIERAGLSEDRIRFAVADARTVRPNRAFDVININNVLHHIDDKRRVLERLHSCLAKDGRLLIVEPNYYYPPRWIIETSAFDPFNFIKEYFVRNSLIEKGEKAIVFTELKKTLKEAGYKIVANPKDMNYLGYFSIYWMRQNSPLARITSAIDGLLMRWLLPRIMAPFEYIVAVKA
jgi:SAM-dependent methyltransferase